MRCRIAGGGEPAEGDDEGGAVELNLSLTPQQPRQRGGGTKGGLHGVFGVDATVGAAVDTVDVFDGKIEQIVGEHHLGLVAQFGILTPTREQGHG